MVSINSRNSYNSREHKRITRHIYELALYCCMVESTGFFGKETAIIEKTEELTKSGKDELEATDKKLRDIYHLLRHRGSDTRGAAEIIEVLRKAHDREFFISQKMVHLDTLSRGLTRLDTSLFPDLKPIIESASGQQRIILIKYLKNEHALIFKKYSIESLIVKTGNNLPEYANSLEMAVLEIGRNNPEAARKWLKKAILFNLSIINLLKRILVIEKKLNEITKKKILDYQKYG